MARAGGVKPTCFDRWRWTRSTVSDCFACCVVLSSSVSVDGAYLIRPSTSTLHSRDVPIRFLSRTYFEYLYLDELAPCIHF
jgi:hypothetical protein